jgi:FkbM family methyltransferase
MSTNVVAWRKRIQRRLTGLRLLLRSRRFLKRVELRPRDDLVELGSIGYGFWVVPQSLFDQNSQCYLVGVGEDITFDLAMIARFGCTVHAFDPTPASQRYAGVAARHEPRFVFHPLGVWSSDGSVRFHAPAGEHWVSHSATDMHGTSVAFEAEVRSVSSLMRELGHFSLDLLKISAEGAEYEIVRGIAEDDVDVRVICVEFAQPAPAGLAEETYDMLTRRGYELVAARISPWNWKVTFVRRAAEDERGPASGRHDRAQELRAETSLTPFADSTRVRKVRT